jgi:DNA polymerase III subunit delta
MAGTKRFTFICGQDDFLVGRLGQERFAAMAADTADEFSREVINGFAANVDEVAAAVNAFRESVQTLPLFGGRRVVHLKDVNFLADSVTGRAETTERLLGDLQAVLESVDPEQTGVLVTAAPVDRRRSFPKWAEKASDFVLVGDGEAGDDALAAVVMGEARALGAAFAPGAVELLLTKVGANTRLLVEEVRKLAAYAAPGPVEEAHVQELTPNVAEGDFFETADAFFSGDLKWALAALQRHFFTGGDARPVLAALQNRNRLLMQVRALIDSGEVRAGPRGIDGLPAAGAAYAQRFGEAAGLKSSFNVFSQNAWYVGKLVSGAKLPALRRLIDNQQEFIAAFEEIHRRPDAQEDVLRDMTVRCLTT